MGLNGSMGLGFVFTARDLASAKMQRLEHRFSSLDQRVGLGTQRMTKNFRQLGMGLAIFAASAIAMAGALSLANAAGKFEQGLAAVGAVSRATSRELGLLRNSAIEAGIKTQFSPTEAIEGLTSLATAGQTATQATETLIPVLDLAAGSLGQLGVAGSAEAVVGTLNAYGMSADRAANVTDRLLRITQLTNFQARDFAAGLAKAAASGATFKQGLDDTLITMGLLRNRNIDASSSATAFREAVRRVGADTRAQNAVISAGVQVFDKSSGRMRSIVDIMSDFARATAKMTDKERNRRVAVAFGARGLLAFNAIQKAAFTTTRDGTKVTLRGADAIAALRKELAGATGTAAKFRDKLLDTFEGQKTLLKGTMQTFAVVLGEPFAKLFKPVVKAIVETLNSLLQAFNSMPASMKKTIAGVALAASAFAMLVGGIIAAKAIIGLLSIAFGALGISLGGILSILLPVILIIGVLAAVVAGFHIAFTKNLGGIGDFAQRVWSKVSLFFRALMQLFQQGGFSGAVRQELNRAENQGLKRFLIAVWMIVHRVQKIWKGFTAGFVSTIEAARPVFKDLADAFMELGTELAILFGGAAQGAASLPSDKFLAFGQVVGSSLATVVKWAVKLVAIYVRIIGGVLAGFRSMFKYIRPALKSVTSALGSLGDAWRTLTGSTKSSSASAKESTKTWRTLGMYLGKVFGAVVTTTAYSLAALIRTIAFSIRVLGAFKDAFVAAGTWTANTARIIHHWFVVTLPASIGSAIRRVVRFYRAVGMFFIGIERWFSRIFAAIGQGVKSFLQPVFRVIATIGRGIRRAIGKIMDFVIKLLRKIPDRLLPSRLEKIKRMPLSTEVKTKDDFVAVQNTQSTAGNASAASSAVPAAAESSSRMRSFDRLEAGLLALVKSQTHGKANRQPIILKVQVDGETIARASHEANEELASRTYSSVPAY